MNYEFDQDKAIAAICFLIEETNETLDMIMKMMYLADKDHLSRYGRFIAGDEYVATEKGPVPSKTYNLIMGAGGGRIKKCTDYDDLSESDLECLENIVSAHKQKGRWVIGKMSYDQLWETNWKSKLQGSRAKMMDVLTTAGWCERRPDYASGIGYLDRFGRCFQL